MHSHPLGLDWCRIGSCQLCYFCVKDLGTRSHEKRGGQIFEIESSLNPWKWVWCFLMLSCHYLNISFEAKKASLKPQERQRREEKRRKAEEERLRKEEAESRGGLLAKRKHEEYNIIILTNNVLQRTFQVCMDLVFGEPFRVSANPTIPRKRESAKLKSAPRPKGSAKRSTVQPGSVSYPWL